jgi:methylase of polypeptide subunit release factors
MKKIERQLQGEFLHVFKTLFSEEKYRDFEIIQEEERADLIVSKSGKALFFLELKDPLVVKSSGDAETFKRETLRAVRIGIPHFGITNFVEASIYSLQVETKENYENRDFPKLSDIERYRNSKTVSKDLNRKLQNLAIWYLKKAEAIFLKGDIPEQAPDEIFILKLQRGIERFGFKISERVFEKYQKSRDFAIEIQNYFQSQQWSIPTEEADFDNFSHIAVLQFVSKIIFYNSIKDFGKYGLGEIDKDDIWNSFEELKEKTGNFELLIGENSFLESKVVEDFSKEIADEVLENSEKYNFSKMKEDIIGRIFEELIKPNERHKLGQYFTSSAVVKTVNAFCIREANLKVLDPSCGSGAFLTEVYERKKSLGEKDHTKLLEEIYGVDISSYPSYLATLNLAIRNLGEKSYPRIVQKDFFQVAKSLEKSVSKEKIHDSDGVEQEVEFTQFDAIVGNPPYTRQEDIDAYNPNQKEQILETLASELGGFTKHISKRTSIYAYFFYRAKRLLKDGGYLGFITSNSWLDVDFGETLQKHLLKNFHVVAIIDSKVERFFESADVNTNITILKKGKGKRTKFVYLKKPLSEVLKKFGGEIGFRDFIEEQNTLFEDEFLRVNPVSQCRLSKDTKWSKYLKAPKVYWEILKKGKGKWKRLGDIANVRFGVKTGANEFFYLEKLEEKGDSYLLKNGIGEEVLIEKRFIKPVIKSPREIKGFVVKPEELKYSVLMVSGLEREEISKKFPNLERYLKRGEERNYHERSSLKSRRKEF